MRMIDADALKTKILDYYSYSWQLREEIGDFFDNAPTIEPYRWIPCSERLPKYEEYVLVTFIDKSAIDTKVMCVRRIEGFVDWYWSDFADEYTWEESEVIAWLPLPEPCGGDSNDNH